MKSEKILYLAVFGGAILLLVMLISSLTGAAPTQSPSSLAVGYVDTEQLQNQLPDFQRLKDEAKDKKAELDLYQGYLLQQDLNTAKGLKDQCDKEKAGKSQADQDEIDKKYQLAVRKMGEEVNDKVNQKGAEMENALNDMHKGIVEKVKKLISDVATQKKLTMVIDKNALWFGGTDITQPVIDQAKKNDADTKNTKPTATPGKK